MKQLYLFCIALLCAGTSTFAQPVTTANPILFVTQTPVNGFTSITQTFSNHNPWIDNAPRGGDLMIRYPDGTLRNLTREAGYGDSSVEQRGNAIAVRQPCVHWSGTKALFSMVIGAPVKQFDYPTNYWQIYEVSGLGKNEKVTITKFAGQPEKYNNISPVYGSDNSVIFTSDMPVGGIAHLYPQLDEYESARVVSGLWKITPTGEVMMIQHSPSGSFYPIVDSYGRILYTRWDHLQRDQQADADRRERKAGQQATYGTITYLDESKDATPQVADTEIFPEPRDSSSPDYSSDLSLHTFNQFFPWEINQDGTEEETVNHVGRHEFGGTYTDGSFRNDPNLNYVFQKSYVKNKISFFGDGGSFHLREDPNAPGTYYCTNAREFGRETAGQILKFTGAIGDNPEDMEVVELTHRATGSSAEEGQTPNPNHSGHYRTPLPMSDGQLIVSHTPSPYANKNLGQTENPKIRYNFRLKTMKQTMIDGVPYFVADKSLTGGIVRSTSYYNGNDYIISRTDTLWELDPVEVKATAVPPLKRENAIPAIEQQVFDETGVDPSKLRAWMKEKKLALIVSRDVTTRDRADNTQPFNLRVPEGGTETIGKQGKVYDVKYMEIFQGDMLRGMGGTANPRAGRRVLARPMHQPEAKNPPVTGAPSGGSVKIGKDGSVASFVPAQRATTWQLSDAAGKGVVRERYWISFQPGEIRTCNSCHGVNKQDQAGMPPPQNKPEALRELLTYWKSQVASSAVNNTPENSLVLGQNYPNPSNTSMTIEYAIPARSLVKIKIYDNAGKEVTTLVSETKEAGEYKVKCNTAKFPSGVYYYKIECGGVSKTKEFTVVR